MHRGNILKEEECFSQVTIIQNLSAEICRACGAIVSRERLKPNMWQHERGDEDKLNPSQSSGRSRLRSSWRNHYSMSSWRIAIRRWDQHHRTLTLCHMAALTKVSVDNQFKKSGEGKPTYPSLDGPKLKRTHKKQLTRQLTIDVPTT